MKDAQNRKLWLLKRHKSDVNEIVGDSIAGAPLLCLS